MVHDGFAGERMVVVPQPVIAESLTRPLLRRLVVTDVGRYPDAGGHERERIHGAPQAIVLVCTAGEGWARVGGIRHRVLPGSAVLLPPGVPHAYGSAQRDPWTIWWCHVQGADR